MSDTNEKTTNPETIEVSRRGLFHILGAAPIAAAAVAGEPAMAQSKAAGHAAYQRKVFDDHQWKTLHVLCDLIIPADERSGSATQAGVPEYIDDWIDFRTREDGEDSLRAEVFGGLTWLDRESRRQFEKPFADSSVDQQKQILDRIAWPEKAAKEDKVWAHFFNTLRDLVAGGFFSSKIGVADLPYLGNTAVPVWKGTDPEVWAVIEDRMKNGYESVSGHVKPWKS